VPPPPALAVRGYAQSPDLDGGQAGVSLPSWNRLQQSVKATAASNFSAQGVIGYTKERQHLLLRVHQHIGNRKQLLAAFDGINMVKLVEV